MAPVDTLDFSNASSLPGMGSLVEMDSDGGRIAVVTRAAPHEILVFDDSGSLRRTVGQRGDGPGEFREITGVYFDAGDSLRVVSRDGRRLDVFDPFYDWVRSQPLDERITDLAGGGATTFAVTADRAEGSVGVLETDGSVTPLWQNSRADRSEFPAGVSALASDGDGRAAFAEGNEYSVSLVTASGGVRSVTGQAPDWFDSGFHRSVVDEFGGMISTAGSTVLGLYLDRASEHLWIVSGVPDESTTADDLRPLFADPPSDRTVIPARLIDHLVEVIDLSTGRKLALQRFDYLPYDFSSQWHRGEGETLEIVVPTLTVQGPASG
jgi:hypothetical protein